MGGVRGGPQVSVLKGRIGHGTQEGEYRRGGSAELRFEALRVTAGHPGRDIQETVERQVWSLSPVGDPESYSQTYLHFISICFSKEGKLCSDSGILKAPP